MFPRSVASAFLLLLSLHNLCTAQASKAGPPRMPLEPRPPTEQEIAEMLAAVCGGEVDAGARACRSCPAFTALAGEKRPFTMRSMIFGSFSSPLSRDMVLDFSGCDGPRETGGSVLVKKIPDGWSMVNYEPMIHTDQCARYRLKERRDILICQSSMNMQGEDAATLFTLDLAAADGDRFRPLLTLIDNTRACPKTWKVERIEKMQLRDMNYDAMPDLEVFVSAGKRDVTEEEQKRCLAGLPPPPAQVHKLAFLFNGREFLVAEWSAQTKKMLEEF